MIRNKLKKSNGYCKRRKMEVNDKQMCDWHDPKVVKRRIFCSSCKNFSTVMPIKTPKKEDVK